MKLHLGPGSAYLAGALLLLAGGASAFDAVREGLATATDWRQVEGEVLDIRRRRFGRQITWRVTVRIRDARGDIERTLPVGLDDLDRYRRGSHVPVFVHPRDPDDVTLSRPTAERAAMMSGFALVFLLLAAGALLLARRLSRRARTR